VRGLGRPVRLTLTAGQKGDAPEAEALIADLPAKAVMADTAHDSDRLRAIIAGKKAKAVIPNTPSRARKYPLDHHLHAQRHLVECCLSKLKQFRRVATRYEKTPETTSPSSPSPLSSRGSGKGPQNIEPFEQMKPGTPLVHHLFINILRG
jgi:transposase